MMSTKSPWWLLGRTLSHGKAGDFSHCWVISLILLENCNLSMSDWYPFTNLCHLKVLFSHLWALQYFSVCNFSTSAEGWGFQAMPGREIPAVNAYHSLTVWLWLTKPKLFPVLWDTLHLTGRHGWRPQKTSRWSGFRVSVCLRICYYFALHPELWFMLENPLERRTSEHWAECQNYFCFQISIYLITWCKRKNKTT